MLAVPLSAGTGGEQHRGGEALERPAVRAALRRVGALWGAETRARINRRAMWTTCSACSPKVSPRCAVNGQSITRARSSAKAAALTGNRIVLALSAGGSSCRWGVQLGGENGGRGDWGSVMHPLS